MFAQGVPFNEVRVMNVLQRLGIAYLVVTLVHYAFVKHTFVRNNVGIFDDITMIWKDWVFMLTMVGAYMGAVYGVAFEGCER